MDIKTSKALNDFVREYGKVGFSPKWNWVKFQPVSDEHQQMVFNICWYLYKEGIPFATEFHMKSGYNPDIICPTHIVPIIEVRHSETEKKTLSKFTRIPEELQNKIIYVDSKAEWKPELIL